MRFSNAFLDEIRDRVPISAVVGQRVTFDRKKSNQSRGDMWACCPFHGEKTPSFHCEDRKGRYHCFGCGVSGDHFRFLTELGGMSFPEAVEQIADMAGVSMPAPDPEAERRDRQRATLVDVMEMATQFFQERLQAQDGATARAYLRGRGLSGRIIETFRLGYAPESRNALKEYLASRNVEKSLIEACGLVVHRQDIAVSYDRFRDRVMFPIPDSRGRIIAFGGRALSDDALAKYLNSNETELFHKSNVLFNYARARKAIGGADGAGTVIAVEGYMDVIALAQAGIDNAVAPLGTALTDAQLELMWRVAQQPVLCFDGDAAGIKAAHRAIDMALPHIRPGRTVRFALLPEGKDPDDLVREEGRAAFETVIAQARPLADMVWAREAGAGIFDTPERRAELEARLRQVVGLVGDENVRRHYQQAMRDRLNAFFAPVSAMPRDRKRDGNRQYDRKGAGGTTRRLAPSERLARSGMVRGHVALPALRECVLALTVVNHPQLVIELFDDIASVEFDNRDLARLWTSLLGAFGERGGLDPDILVQALEADGHAGLVAAMDRQVRNARLWTATPEAAIEDARDGFLQALSLHKRSRALRRQKSELEQEIAEATEAGDGDAVPLLMRMLNEVKLEETRLAHQEAMIDGFGVLSGRVKGPAPT